MTSQVAIVWSKAPGCNHTYGHVGKLPMFLIDSSVSGIYRLKANLCGKTDVPFDGLSAAKACADQRLNDFLRLTGLVFPEFALPELVEEAI